MPYHYDIGSTSCGIDKPSIQCSPPKLKLRSPCLSSSRRSRGPMRLVRAGPAPLLPLGRQQAGVVRRSHRFVQPLVEERRPPSRRPVLPQRRGHEDLEPARSPASSAEVSDWTDIRETSSTLGGPSCPTRGRRSSIGHSADVQDGWAVIVCSYKPRGVGRRSHATQATAPLFGMSPFQQEYDRLG